MLSVPFYRCSETLSSKITPAFFGNNYHKIVLTNLLYIFIWRNYINSILILSLLFRLPTIVHIVDSDSDSDSLSHLSNSNHLTLCSRPAKTWHAGGTVPCKVEPHLLLLAVDLLRFVNFIVVTYIFVQDVEQCWFFFRSSIIISIIASIIITSIIVPPLMI